MAFDILGGFLGLGGQLATNESNADIARMNNQFNAQQAQLNRQFQAEMSNTAHQREVDDLRKAGLNPLLSVNAGASSPGGGSASSSGNPVMQNPMESLSGIGSALRDLSRLENETNETNARIESTKVRNKVDIANSNLDPDQRKKLQEEINKLKYDQQPNTLHQYLLKRIGPQVDKLFKSLESNVGNHKSNQRRMTEKFIREMNPSDWSKIFNAHENMKNPRRGLKLEK